MAAVQQRAARARSFRQGQDRQHARRDRRPPTGRSACSTRRCANTSRRWRSARPSPTCGPSSARRCGRWAICPRSIRELELVRAEHPRYAPGRIHLGLSYHAAGRRDDAAAQWQAVLEADPDNRSAQDVPGHARGDAQGAGAAATRAPRSSRRRRRARPSPLRPRRSPSRRSPPIAPSGEGTHLFLWIEKRGLTTFDAIARIARALGVAPRDVGYAGLKDRHALTRQQLSVPGIDPARALEIAAPISRS